MNAQQFRNSILQQAIEGRLLASDIKAYFEENPSANEVLIFKGNKQLLVSFL